MCTYLILLGLSANTKHLLWHSLILSLYQQCEFAKASTRCPSDRWEKLRSQVLVISLLAQWWRELVPRAKAWLSASYPIGIPHRLLKVSHLERNVEIMQVRYKCAFSTAWSPLHLTLSIWVSTVFSLVIYLPLHFPLLTQSRKSRRDQWKNFLPLETKWDVYETRYTNGIIWSLCDDQWGKTEKALEGFAVAQWTEQSWLQFTISPVSWGCSFSNLKHHSEQRNDDVPSSL